MKPLKELFTKYVTSESLFRPIDSMFLKEENLADTNYRAAYQREYVWDEAKATYFIESILIGTEVPPLIFFDGAQGLEVIDGRQRYETIVRFFEDKFILRKSALKVLTNNEDVCGKCFSKLPQIYKDLFKNSKLRCVNFHFTDGNHCREEEDAVKIEIFQRYNTGITPLRKSEVDNAAYYYDDFNTYVKDNFTKDVDTYELFRRVLCQSKNDLNVAMIEVRELLVLPEIPITYYAGKTRDAVEMFYETKTSALATSDFEDIYKSFVNRLELIDKLYSHFRSRGVTYNRQIAECLFWGLSILEMENRTLEWNLHTFDSIVRFFYEKEELYSGARSSFRREIIARYNATADLFFCLSGVDFAKYLSSDVHIDLDNNAYASVTNNDDTEPIDIKSLRLRRQEAVTEMVDDVCDKLKRNRILLRPAYQRREVINRKKSSMIIESILLGIKLPPIFIYHRSDGKSEVIDGQQRLLTLLGFMGKAYTDENGNEVYSEKNGFRLDLKNSILSDYTGRTYSELSNEEQSRIKRNMLWVVEIEEDLSPKFDSVDLFVRLNSRPYPIDPDSFEMWNSYIDRELITSLSDLWLKNKSWLYVKKNNKRMEGKNLVTILTYFQYLAMEMDYKGDLFPYDAFDLFSVANHITCRLRDKHKITTLLEDKVKKNNWKEAILALDKDFVSKMKILVNQKNDTEANFSLENLMGLKRNRTQQAFYILWMLLVDMSFDVLMANTSKIYSDIRDLLILSQDCSDADDYKRKVRAFKRKYNSSRTLISPRDQQYVSLNSVANVSIISEQILNNQTEADFVIQLPSINQKANVLIQVMVPSFRKDYVEALCCSQIFIRHCCDYAVEAPIQRTEEFRMPILPLATQNTISTVWNMIKSANDADKQLLDRVLELMIGQLYKRDFFDRLGIDVIEEVSMILEKFDDRMECNQFIREMKNEQSSQLSLSLLKTINYKPEDR